VERESIDLVDSTLAKYNSELLLIAGTLYRILYENEMDQIMNLYKNNNYDCRRFEKWATYALRNFTFNPSTPNEKVSIKSESQFFDCRNELSILSTNGVFPISNVRIPNSEMEGFIKKVPTVPKIIFDQCGIFFEKAKEKKLIEGLTLQDVFCELESRELSEDELMKLMKWWISYKKGNSVSSSEITQFMRLARIGSRALNTIRYVLNPGIIPPDVDIPDVVLSYSISKHFERQDLERYIGWSELTLVDWARFIVKKSNLETSPTFARRVHQILAKGLNNTSRNNKEIIRQLFVEKRCVPTNCGMEFPNKAYFESASLFPNLPTIQFEKPLSVQNLMELLGVRKVNKFFLQYSYNLLAYLMIKLNL
jgi:hypothetical protein